MQYSGPFLICLIFLCLAQTNPVQTVVDEIDQENEACIDSLTLVSLCKQVANLARDEVMTSADSICMFLQNSNPCANVTADYYRAKYLIAEGSVDYYKGRYPSAQNRITEGLAILNRISGAETEEISDAYAVLGGAYVYMQENSKAFDCFFRRLRFLLAQPDKDSSTISVVYGAIAANFLYVSKGEDAYTYLTYALEYLPKSDLRLRAVTYSQMGSYHNGKGEFGRAITMEKNAIRTCFEMYDTVNSQFSTYYDRLGSYFFSSGRTDSAIYYSNKAIASIHTNAGKPNRDPELAYCFYKLAYYYEAGQHWNVTDEYLDSVLFHINYVVADSFESIYDRRMFQGVLVTQSRFAKARFVLDHDMCHLRIGRKAEEVSSEFQDFLYWTRSGPSKYLYAQQRQDHFSSASMTCLLLFEETDSLYYAEQAFNYSIRAKGIYYAEELIALEDVKKHPLPDSVATRMRALNQELLQVRLLKEGMDRDRVHISDSVYQDVNDRFYSVLSAKASFEEEVIGQMPLRESMLADFEEMSADDVRRQLPSDSAAIIDYLIANDTLVIGFVITRDRFIAKQLPMSERLDSLVNRVLWQIEDESKEYYKTSRSLYQDLISPFDEVLAQVKHLIINPDGILSIVPFAALRLDRGDSGQEPEFFVEHYSVSIRNIIPQTATASGRRAPKPKILAIAPSYVNWQNNATALRTDPAKSREYFGPLAFNEAEADEVVTVFGGKAIKGSEATKANFFNYADDYSIVHLATHASADRELGLLSRVVFQPSESTSVGDSLSNMMFYEDLSQINLNAEMVVLSACETGIGNVQKGEGVMNLPRAFQMAGAKSVIVSLWPVDDKSTMLIMKDYYDQLALGMSKDQALRRAQLNYLQVHPGAEPRIWASFLPFGEMRPFPVSSNRLLSLLLVVLIGLGVVAAVLRRSTKVHAQ